VYDSDLRSVAKSCNVSTKSNYPSVPRLHSVEHEIIHYRKKNHCCDEYCTSAYILISNIQLWVHNNKAHYISISYGRLFLQEGFSCARFVGIAESTTFEYTVWL
jgi:hypothetical protein